MTTTRTLAPAVAAPPASPFGPDEPLYEIVDGQRVEIPHMSVLASIVASRLAYHLYDQLRKLGQGAIEVLFRLALPLDRRRRPDVAFVSYVRWPKDRRLGDEDAWDVVPNLAVEVVSPHDLADELLEKIGEYFRAGVEQVWVVYPKPALVYVYESLTQVRGLGRGDTLEGGAVLPSFRLALGELFPAV